MAPIFASVTDFRHAFETGLDRLLGASQLGGYILALANATMEQELFASLHPRLQAGYLRWRHGLERGDRAVMDAPPDDRVVFERLLDVGFERLRSSAWRRVGPWELQFNPLRSLRPARISALPVALPVSDFDPAAFHFNKPFLRDEVLWEGELAGQPVRLLFNKFPFLEHHTILVPAPARESPQWLDGATIAWLWDLLQHLGDRLPQLGLAFNSYGAHASVNHLHLQCFLREQGAYPIESDAWRHNGGSRDYPLPVMCFSDPLAAKAEIDRMNREHAAFNLLCRRGRIYLIRRALQGSHAHSPWSGGFAWAEVAGCITLSDAQAFSTLGSEDIEAELRLLFPV